jgi:hypothetical protein
MKLGIMQPYFFPYMGYWQLIHAVDCFVLLDDVQYIRHGWINRNRILKPGDGWQYAIVPLEKHPMTAMIREVRARNNDDWRHRILRQIAHYKKKTQHFEEVNKLIHTALFDTNDTRIAYINLAIILRLCHVLGLERKVVLSSDLGFDYKDVSHAGEWALRITEQMAASQYINPIGGATLFDRDQFVASGAEIRFLQSRPIVYSQRRDTFETSLSIIDVLMFNGVQGTSRLLEEYDVVEGNNA